MTIHPGRFVRWASGLNAYMQLLRISQVSIVVTGSLIGVELADMIGLPNAAIAMVIGSNVLLFCGSIAFNDWHDVAEDSVNRPARPIPSGRISRDRALQIALAMFAGATVLALIVSWEIGILAVLVSVLSVGYSLRWKGVPFLGNTVVAVVSAYPLWCWLPLQTMVDPTLLILVAACVIFRLGAELVKTGEDYVGDQRAAIRTVATCKGAAYANRLGVTLMFCALLLALLIPDRSLILNIALACCLLLATGAGYRTLKNVTADQLESGHLVFVGRTIMVVMVTTLLLDVHLFQ